MQVKLLLVGEGPTEYGREEDGSEGALQPLVRAILEVRGEKAIVFQRQRLMSLPKEPGRLKGVRKQLQTESRKTYSALALAFDQDGVVFVRDADRKGSERLEAIRHGLAEARKSRKEQEAKPVAVGVPKETIEAWLLGDPRAFERACGKVPPRLPRKPESLWGDKKNPESKHPKPVLERMLLSLNVRDRTTDLAEARQAVAEKIDPEALATTCPESFRPFLQEVRAELLPLLAPWWEAMERAVLDDVEWGLHGND